MFSEKDIKEALSDDTGYEMQVLLRAFATMMIDDGMDWLTMMQALTNAGEKIFEHHCPPDDYRKMVEVRLETMKEKVAVTETFLETYEEEVKKAMMQIAGQRYGSGNA
jgi:hypothetical protein